MNPNLILKKIRYRVRSFGRIQIRIWNPKMDFLFFGRILKRISNPSNPLWGRIRWIQFKSGFFGFEIQAFHWKRIWKKYWWSAGFSSTCDTLYLPYMTYLGVQSSTWCHFGPFLLQRPGKVGICLIFLKNANSLEQIKTFLVLVAFFNTSKYTRLRTGFFSLFSTAVRVVLHFITNVLYLSLLCFMSPMSY